MDEPRIEIEVSGRDRRLYDRVRSKLAGATRGAPPGRGHDQHVGQSQRGQTGAPSVSGQRIAQNIVQASASSIRKTCFRLTVRAAAVSRKCWDMDDLRVDDPGVYSDRTIAEALCS